jgi:hypothetical protein
MRADDNYADPFRLEEEPRVASVAAVEAARREHRAAPRRLFEELDVLIFTLGLTEAWGHVPTARSFQARRASWPE